MGRNDAGDRGRSRRIAIMVAAIALFIGIIGTIIIRRAVNQDRLTDGTAVAGATQPPSAPATTGPPPG